MLTANWQIVSIFMQIRIKRFQTFSVIMMMIMNNKFRGMCSQISFGVLCPDASWESGDRASSSAGVGSAQDVVGQVSFIFLHHMTCLSFTRIC